jgi:hypothetical protein
MLAPPPLWLHKLTDLPAHNFAHSPDIFLGSLTLPVPESGDFLKLVLLYIELVLSYEGTGVYVCVCVCVCVCQWDPAGAFLSPRSPDTLQFSWWPDRYIRCSSMNTDTIGNGAKHSTKKKNPWSSPPTPHTYRDKLRPEF